MRPFDEKIKRAMDYTEAQKIMKEKDAFFKEAICHGDINDQVRCPSNAKR